MSNTARRRISQGSTFEEMIGYSRAVVDGRWVLVSGTTGYDYSTMTISDDVGDQVEQTRANIDAALEAAGATAADVVRVKYYLPNPGHDAGGRPGRREYEDRDRGNRPQALLAFRS
jgi:enamine deaminase RidA (YjgF/YER057c/UK114 family)